MAENVLRIENLTMQFGGVVAVNNLTMDVQKDEIVALIGPNGAGKTTVFNAVTGVYPVTNGRITLRGRKIAEGHPAGKMKQLYAGGHLGEYPGMIKFTPDRITARGIARTFQNIRLFKDMTVMENVLVAEHMHIHANVLTATLTLSRGEDRRMREKALDLIKLMGLYAVRDEKASALPYGKQRHLEIMRALATQPGLLLLDEPAAGMNPQETDELSAFIMKIRTQFSLTVLLIEHQMNLVMDISDRIYVIDFGKLIAEGTPAQVQNNPDVITAYLGVDEE
jgi:branched-chain amino acid transport system ATP-binding protein